MILNIFFPLIHFWKFIVLSWYRIGRSLNKKNSYDSYLSDICQLIKHNFANVDLCVQKTQMACLAEFCNVDILAIEIFKPNWDFKFWNPTIYNIIRWFAGTNDSSTKRLMFQVLLFSWFLAKFFAKMVSMYFLIFL